MQRSVRHIIDRFYDAYWSQGREQFLARDPTNEDRKRRLALALSKFLDGSRRGRLAGKVLDAGCGSGEFTVFIERLGFDVVGLDISSAAIEKAKTLCPSAQFYASSLEEKLPFNDGDFDAVWSTEVLEHLFDVHACLSEFNRVLRNKKILILTTPSHGLLKNLAITLVGFEKHYNPYLSHIRFFTKRSLTGCLTRAGFEPMLWRGIGRVWPLYKSFFVVARKVRAPGPAPEIVG